MKFDQGTASTCGFKNCKMLQIMWCLPVCTFPDCNEWLHVGVFLHKLGQSACSSNVADSCYNDRKASLSEMLGHRYIQKKIVVVGYLISIFTHIVFLKSEFTVRDHVEWATERWLYTHTDPLLHCHTRSIAHFHSPLSLSYRSRSLSLSLSLVVSLSCALSLSLSLSLGLLHDSTFRYMS